MVLKGRGDRKSSAGPIGVGDDHLVGSPSVLKISGKYYMFYEAIGTLVTPINRVWSPTHLDTWVSNQDMNISSVKSVSPCSNTRVPDWDGSYPVLEGALGYAPYDMKPGTHPIYAGEVNYLWVGGSGKINRFLSKNPIVPACGGEIWRTLNNGEPAFWAYDNPGPGRVSLYSCFDVQYLNTYASLDVNCEGHGLLFEQLGYIAQSLDSNDMVDASQNQVFMATSSDGVNWERFAGPGRNQALIDAYRPRTAEYNSGCSNPDLGVEGSLKVVVSYGAGFPSALVRDDTLELYFYEESFQRDGCAWLKHNFRVTLPVADIENVSAWASANELSNRQVTVTGTGSDIAWSPMRKRYFTIGTSPDNITPTCSPNHVQSPTLVWSDYDPPISSPASFPAGNTFQNRLPTNVGNTNSGRWGEWGAIATDTLNNTLDFASPFPYTAFHIFYSAQDSGACGAGFSPSNPVFDVASRHDMDYIISFAYGMTVP